MFEHTTVLKEEAIKQLNIKDHGTYVDCTVGGGGHALSILKALDGSGQLIAFDQDIDALKAAKNNLSAYEHQVTFIHKNFKHLESQLRQRNIDEVDGILFDLGVSSPQFDRGERGFSYRSNARLDMRMNQEQALNAHTIVNEWSFHNLVSILRHYGEERFAKQIARNIERERKNSSIDTTDQLVEIIKQSIPAPARRRGGHPARRTFQALRIAVNDELKVFNDALHQAARMIKKHGRIAVITFHSLEDRICKQAFRTWSRHKPIPRNFPVMPEGHEAPFKEITKKPIVPTDEELKQNRRARSAKLRVVEKVNEWSDDFIYEERWRS